MKPVSRFLSFMLAVLTLFTALPVLALPAAAEDYPTLLSGDAINITDETEFQFTPTESGTYRFYSTDNDGDPYGYLYDAGHNLITSDDDGSGNVNFKIEYDLTAGETYYLKASFWNGGSGSYTVCLELIGNAGEVHDGWSLVDGVLTISADFVMEDYSWDGAPWYPYMSEITSVVLEDGVTKIGEYSFYECRNLSSVSIPDSVTTIGEHAFYGCDSLTDIYCEAESQPDGWDEWWLDGCDATVHWGSTGPELLQLLPGDAITIDSETEFTFIPTESGTYRFYSTDNDGDPYGYLYDAEHNLIASDDDGNGNRNFKIEYDLTAGQTYYLKATFYSGGSGSYTVCLEIKEPTYVVCDGWSLVDGVLTISADFVMEDYSWDGAPWYPYMSEITSVVLEDGVTKIGKYSFYECCNLSSVSIPDSVKSIGDIAFFSCDSLTSVTIPDSVTTIGDYAFGGCNSLTDVTIPDSVTTIGGHAFEECYSLTDISVAEASTAYASENGVLYNKTKTELICCPAGKAGSVTIPGSVTTIGSYAFEDCSSLTSVTIPDSVTTIGDSAFSDCYFLTNVTIPGSVTTIGVNAFCYCDSLSNIYCEAESQPEGWDSSWLDNCNATVHWGSAGPEYTEIDLGDVVVIDGLTFLSFVPAESGWYRFTLSDTDVDSERYLFLYDADHALILSDCSYWGRDILTYRCYLDAGRTYYLELSFSAEFSGSCKFSSTLIYAAAEISLNEAVTLNDRTELLFTPAESGIYEFCVTARQDQQYFRMYLFADAEYRAEDGNVGPSDTHDPFVIGNLEAGRTYYLLCLYDGQYTVRVKKLHTADIDAGQTVFADQNTVYRFIPEETGSYKFYSTDCVGNPMGALFDENGHEIITNYDRGSYLGVNFSLKTILEAGNTYYLQVRGEDDSFVSCSVHLENTTNSWSYSFDEASGTLTISGTGEIPDYQIPGSIYYHGEAPWFYEGLYEQIEHIVIEEGITYIGNNAFAYDSNVTDVSLPDSLVAIGQNAFFRCTLLGSLQIPDGVSYIGSGTFAGCTNLNIIDLGDNPYFVFEEPLLFNAAKTEVIACLQKAEGTLVIPSGVTSIGDYTFYGCSSLTNVTIPDSVTSIGYDAFYGCSGLTSVTIPDSVTSIGSGAFDSCTSLTSVTIPDSVTNIGEGAFEDCHSLTSVTIPDSVTSIDEYTFYGCSSLTNVTIPDSVTSIGYAAFRGCSSLTSVTIPDSVTTIDYKAFDYCESLTDIYCEAESQPEGWDEWWIYECDATVHWGSTGPDEPELVTGDLNEDGTLSILDVTKLLIWIKEASVTPERLTMGDLNEDGTLSILDVTALLRMLSEQ